MGTEQRLQRRTRRRTEVDGSKHIVPQAQCPRCSCWGDCDADHIAGTVSIVCPECGWHGYIDGRVVD